MAIQNDFNDIVGYYDSWVKKALPAFDDLFNIPLEIIKFDTNEKIRVLDLGAGTGLFSSFILQKYTKAEFVLIDLAEKMLEVSMKRFEKYTTQFIYKVEDYSHLEDLDIGSFDLIISSLSIHHLLNNDKKLLFNDIFRSLKTDGLFINIDQIKGDSEYLSKLYWDQWLLDTKQNGGTEEEIQRSIERRKKYDNDITQAEHIRLLKSAGFTEVDCIYKKYFIGIFYAKK